MSPKLQPVRGTHDILPEEFEAFSTIVNMARQLAVLDGFQEMATPVFEPTDVFARSLGDTSDIVHKEMFTFETKGGESVTLRPEFTAGIVRAFISNGMQQHLPLKLFATGPLFRYERPQKGRQRQFHQVNFEWLGDASPQADIELILLAGRLLFYLSGGQGCKLLINTLGDLESRHRYRDALVAYLTPYASQLSEDSQRRLAANPLRILDSKDPADRKVTADAPKITDYLSDSSRDRFAAILKVLQAEEAPFFMAVEESPSLVRGLDYYTDTVFEFVAEAGELGAQNTVLAGGRYDGLVEQMGGKPTPAIGFAAGVERLQLLLKQPGIWREVKDTKIIIVPFDGVPNEYVLLFTAQLRNRLYHIINQHPIKQKCIVEIAWQGSVKKRMERAGKMQASHVVIMAPDELSRKQCAVKDMGTGQQAAHNLEDFADDERIGTIFQLIR